MVGLMTLVTLSWISVWDKGRRTVFQKKIKLTPRFVHEYLRVVLEIQKFCRRSSKMIQKKKALDNEECAAKLKHMVNQVHSNKMVFGKGKAQQSFSLLTVTSKDWTRTLWILSTLKYLLPNVCTQLKKDIYKSEIKYANITAQTW